GGEQFPRGGAGLLEDVGVALEIGDQEGGQAVLPRAEQLAGSAELKINLGQFKAVVRLFKRREALAGGVGLRVAEHAAETGMLSPGHAAAELVELRQA